MIRLPSCVKKAFLLQSEANFHLLRQRRAGGDVPAQDGLGRDLVDVLPAGAAGARERPGEFVVGDLQEWGDFEHTQPLQPPNPPRAGPPQTPFTKTDWLLLGALLALILPLRCWLLYNTEVTARDSIGYIRYALTIRTLALAGGARKEPSASGLSRFDSWPCPKQSSATTHRRPPTWAVRLNS